MGEAACVTPQLLVASRGPERLPMGAFAAGIPLGRKGMLPGGAWGGRDLRERLLGTVAGSAHSATPSSVVALLDPQRAGLLLEDASPNHLGQLLSVAPGMGLHTGPGARQSVESLLRTAAHLQHLRVPLARLPQQAPGETQG